MENLKSSTPLPHESFRVARSKINTELLMEFLPSSGRQVRGNGFKIKIPTKL